MHINYTHAEFGTNFLANHQFAKSIFTEHPLLQKKHNLITTFDAQNVVELSKNLSQFAALLDAEKPLWENITFARDTIQRMPLHSTERKELHEEECEFVKEHAHHVRQKFGSAFTQLEEYAIISQSQKYDTAHQDYQRFQQAVDTLNQLDLLNKHISTQSYLAQKIQTKLQGQAQTITDDVQQLIDSHDGQLGIIARMPNFRI